MKNMKLIAVLAVALLAMETGAKKHGKVTVSSSVSATIVQQKGNSHNNNALHRARATFLQMANQMGIIVSNDVGGNGIEYLLYDIDGDGIKEILMRGGGLNAIYTVRKGKVTPVTKGFGEYEELSVSNEGFVCNLMTSGKSANTYEQQYYRLQNSQLQFIITHSVDDEEATDEYWLMRKGKKQKLNATRAMAYLPQSTFTSLNALGLWKTM